MPIYEASFKLRHDCPYRELSEQYPDLTVREWHLDDCQALEVTSPTSSESASSDDVVDEVGSMGEILHTSESDDGSGIRVVARSCSCPLEDSVIQELEDHSCLYMPPTVYRQGWEHYTVTAFDEGDVESLLRDLDEDREIEVISKTSLRERRMPYTTVTAETLVDDITPRQLEALRIALDNGYYDEPRNSSVADLSERTDVARSTYEEHLRKAENTLISNAGEILRVVSEVDSSSETCLRKAESSHRH
ncbi:MAG: helix-turn-helix domain-containing protein [Halobacteria archaeon]|nr:helix-turn-helix domain-containing protein [Halobacteria archaeon]